MRLKDDRDPAGGSRNTPQVEQIPLETGRLWLAPLVLGLLLLSLVYLLYMGPFWTWPGFTWLALGIAAVAAAFAWYQARWTRGRALFCAADGLHVVGAGPETVIPWADLAEVEVGHNLHLTGSDNWSLEATRPDGSSIRTLTAFVFTDPQAAQQARSTIIRWREAQTSTTA